MTTDKRALTAAARDAIREAALTGGGLSIASSTLWEIAMISGKGRFLFQAILASSFGT
jgi:hypothetical protein